MAEMTLVHTTQYWWSCEKKGYGLKGNNIILYLCRAILRNFFKGWGWGGGICNYAYIRT